MGSVVRPCVRQGPVLEKVSSALGDNVDCEAFGDHRTVFLGDHRQDFKNLAKLIGYDVVEKDR